MKSLKHNGIYVPKYEYKGLGIIVKGRPITLGPKTEQMAIAYVSRRIKMKESPDEVFDSNFFKDFLRELASENPTLKFEKKYFIDYASSLQGFYEIKKTGKGIEEGKNYIDFFPVLAWILAEKEKKEKMSKEEKKKLSEERKRTREKLKEKYGYAEIDGIKVELANWTAEPSCLYIGRGNHPFRGRWKEGPKEEDIELNLSPDAPMPEGNWKGRVWEPNKMWIARWKDKLTGKMKYVWFSPSAFLMQEREKEKFRKAEELEKKIEEIHNHILNNLSSKDEKRRKVSTVCWLIYSLNVRVGDEKDKDEADTVGAITLRPEHIQIKGNRIHFDFLGKDSVRWEKEIEAPKEVIENIKEFMSKCKNYLFEGITSKDVSIFLSEVVPKLTAKVFRTWKCTKTVREYLEKVECKKEDPEYYKKFVAKMANLEGAKVCNHKKKLPDKFFERLQKKRENVIQLEAKLEMFKNDPKKSKIYSEKLDKALYDLQFTEESGEWNLNTSRNSYINPKVYWEWMKKVELPPNSIYSKAQLKKFSWAFEDAS